MRKTFVLPLLTALPALLTACQSEVAIDRYQRLQFNSYRECREYYQPQIAQGLQNPCARSGSAGVYYGPYTYNSGASQRYVGYDAGGNRLSTGLSYDGKRGTYGSFKVGGVSRGGLTSTARGSGGSFGG